AAAILGCREAGVASAPLHFPGLGAASQDTSRGPATVGLDPESLAARDLVPFEAAFAERVPAVVLSLAIYTAYDPVTPGALAEPVVTGLLRERLGFEGVAITDDLGAGAVRAGHTVDEAAVEALAAGADLLQIGSPEDQVRVREGILAALESGELPEARLQEAAARVLELKLAQGLFELPSPAN
ncbi:MAG: glycoside hydrolase family 3 N-terminal domain-containing protein, partial [Solirubrobacterales bacterium]